MNVPPPVPATSTNPLLADALARAQALATSKPTLTLKRPSDDSYEGPDLKKPFYEQNMMGAAPPGPGMSTEQVMVPDNMVGLIIGRGGEQITRLQADSGCKIQLSQDSQGMPHRLCTLTGSGEAISIARSMIDEIISNEGNRGARGMGGGQGGAGGAGFEMMVPGHLVARIIGKGGEVIKALQEETGAKIVIIQDNREFADEKPLKISGTPEAVEFAKQRVEQVISEEQQKMGGGRGGGFRGGRGQFDGFRGGRGGGRRGGWPSSGGGYQDSGYDVTDTVSIPSSKVGLVMGKGGETIRSICSESGAHCQVDKTAPDGAREKHIVIKGRSDAVERAKELINDKIGGGYDRGPRGGGGGFPQQELSHPSVPGGQPDYSSQWAEYYRSLGMVKEAEIIELQSQARAAPVQPQLASDYSAQWAEYYRSVGKIQEAEAIEAQMRVKGPPMQPQFGAPGQLQFGQQQQFY
eukprot:GFUD01025851.1.p1 GENE.GFUD01025851.1~~GFUD01025851.1.p1  ORF type:complete len:465 (+),score=130.06 GFUD01025851.1:140-1534(+)